MSRTIAEPTGVTIPPSVSNTKQQQANRIDCLLRPAEAAKVLGISTGTLYNWVSAHKLSVVKMGHIIRFRPQTLEQFIIKHERRAIP